MRAHQAAAKKQRLEAPPAAAQNGPPPAGQLNQLKRPFDEDGDDPSKRLRHMLPEEEDDGGGADWCANRQPPARFAVGVVLADRACAAQGCRSGGDRAARERQVLQACHRL